MGNGLSMTGGVVCASHYAAAARWRGGQHDRYQRRGDECGGAPLLRQRAVEVPSSSIHRNRLGMLRGRDLLWGSIVCIDMRIVRH